MAEDIKIDAVTSITKYTEKRVWDCRWEKVHWTHFGFTLSLIGEFSIWGFGRRVEFGRLRERTVIKIPKHTFNIPVKADGACQ